eukprot:COSAG02_NODE_198_length_29564_cov_12.279009_5_plen_86_part_00
MLVISRARARRALRAFARPRALLPYRVTTDAMAQTRVRLAAVALAALLPAVYGLDNGLATTPPMVRFACIDAPPHAAYMCTCNGV